MGINSSAPRTLPEGRTDFEYAFTRGATFTAFDGSTLLVKQVSVGDLILPSGQLIVCDPCYLHHLDNAPPLAQSVAPGRYEVVLALVRPATAAPHLNRVACALLRFADVPAVRWMMALRPGENVANLRPGEFYGHGVDSGMSCMVDAGAVTALDDNARTALYWDGVVASNERDGWHSPWVNVPIPGGAGANLIAFRSGYGDGAYPSWWAVDAGGAICALAIDFHVLVEHRMGEARFALYTWSGRTLDHPDLQQLGITARVMPVEREARELRVVIDGGECEIKVIDRHGAVRASHGHITATDGQVEHVLIFDESLPADATLTLCYTLGLRGL